MQSFVDFIQSFLGLGATVILPVAIFILGVFFGQKVGKAFRSAVTIGVAFVGIFLVIDLLTLNLGSGCTRNGESIKRRIECN